MSQNDKPDFVNTELWNLYRGRFKSPVTEASYRSDITEFCCFTGKSFERTDREDVERYFRRMEKRIEKGEISPLTVTKKFRELHSFARFLKEEGEVCAEDYFYPYLKNMKKEDRLAKSVPVEHMDALLGAASDNIMCYAILSLMYRAGLSSTEIAAPRMRARLWLSISCIRGKMCLFSPRGGRNPVIFRRTCGKY